MAVQREPQLQSTSIEVAVDAVPQPVFRSLCALVGSLWNVDETDIVAADPPVMLVHSVRLDGQIGCWLTWEITLGGGQTSVVRLVHDDADLWPGPVPELGEVIAELNARLMQAGAITHPQPTGDAAP